jgi:ribonuclease III
MLLPLREFTPNPLVTLQRRISYEFRDPSWLERAVTHPSLLQERPDLTESNQRLEFLGDAVLQILLGEQVFHLFPLDREGLLSKRRSLLVNRAILAELALEIGLDACLRLSASEESTGGRTRPSSLGDAFEALVGAIYLDSNLDRTREVVLGIYGDLAARLAPTEQADNPKGRLQELVQPMHGNNALRYEVTEISGEDHARDYEVEVYLLDRPLGRGRGPSKKLAEEAAARMALLALNEPEPDKTRQD